MYAFSKDGQADDIPGLETSKAFLTHFPRGAYTTARTYEMSSVFEFNAHVERIAQSASLMLEDRVADFPSLTDAKALRPRMSRSFGACIAEFQRKHPGQAKELKLTLLADWEDSQGPDEFRLYCHGVELPPVPSPPVSVEVRGHPRQNALAKDSKWITDRESLEALKSPSTNEIVMPDENGCLMEGTQTNFYAILDGTLYTAGGGILEGTVRRLVLEVCRQHAIPVRLEPPNIRDLDQWEGALISSTSRLALPIDEIIVPTDGERVKASDKRRHLPSDGLARRLAGLVAEQVKAHSEPVDTLPN